MPINRPRLMVLTGIDASLSTLDVAAAAADIADLTFLVDAGDAARYPELRAVATALGPTAVVDFGDPEGCIRATREAAADRGLTFVDRLCGLTAAINHGIGADVDRATTWGMKDVQRALLREAGVSRIPAARVENPVALREFTAAYGLPMILKPVDGVSSRDIWLLRDEADVAGAVSAVWPDGSSTAPMLVERFLVGDTRAEPHLADYVSAEIFRCGGKTASAFVTDRLQPMAPCRETGLVLPSSLPVGAQNDAIRVAEAALDAIRAADGAFHVELKPRAGGAEIIELNGRLGGYIARLAAYGAGLDLGAAAIGAAIGHRPVLDFDWRRCALVLLFQPPMEARGVAGAPARSTVLKRPGVIAVDDLAVAGTRIDWRDGSNSAVAKVWLGADSAGDLHARLIEMTEFLTDTFAFVQGNGIRTTDRTWLDTIAGHGSEQA